MEPSSLNRTPDGTSVPFSATPNGEIYRMGNLPERGDLPRLSSRLPSKKDGLYGKRLYSVAFLPAFRLSFLQGVSLL